MGHSGPQNGWQFHPVGSVMYRCNPTTGEADYTYPAIGYWKRVPNTHIAAKAE